MPSWRGTRTAPLLAFGFALHFFVVLSAWGRREMFTHWVKGGGRGTLRVGTWDEDDNGEALAGFGGACDRLPTCAPIGWSAGHDAYVVLVCGG